MADIKEKNKITGTVAPGVKLDKQELQNLIQIVSTHPTPSGVGSQEGNVKILLINKLSQMNDKS